MKSVLFIASLLLISTAAFGQTYSNASLSGSYSVQFGDPATYVWSKTFTCPTNSAISYTAASSMTTTSVSSGVVTFDGAGNVSLSFTTTGQFNSTASANTTSVTWNSSCQVTAVNSGHVVYSAATTKAASGTYSVQSNGTGTITQTGSSQGLTFVLAGTNSSGISTTVLLANAQTNGKSIGSGIAVHQ